jgi:hypothetical protein
MASRGEPQLIVARAKNSKDEPAAFIRCGCSQLDAARVPYRNRCVWHFDWRSDCCIGDRPADLGPQILAAFTCRQAVLGNKGRYRRADQNNRLRHWKRNNQQHRRTPRVVVARHCAPELGVLAEAFVRQDRGGQLRILDERRKPTREHPRINFVRYQRVGVHQRHGHVPKQFMLGDCRFHPG